jgi:Trypsin-co-occurring domain 2
MGDNDDGKIPLNDLIQQVRSELTAAVRQRHERESQQGEDDGPGLVVEKVTLELNCVIENSQKGEIGGKANFFAIMFKGGGEVQHSKEQVHKVTVELTAWEHKGPGKPGGGGGPGLFELPAGIDGIKNAEEKLHLSLINTLAGGLKKRYTFNVIGGQFVYKPHDVAKKKTSEE